MNSSTSKLFAAIAVFAALIIPVRLAAQDTAATTRSAKHHHYRLIILGTLGGQQSYGDGGHGAANVTNRGVAAGVADTVTPDPNYPNFNPLMTNFGPHPYVFHAFVSNGGPLVDLGALPEANSSTASRITENGLVAGQSLNGAIDPLTGWPEENAVLWKDGQLINLGTLGGYESGSGSVNSRGQVVGFSGNTVPEDISISLLNLGTQTRAFVWENGVMRDIGTLGGHDAFAVFINEHGQVAGFSYTNSTVNQTTGVPTADPFLWENGRMIDLGTLGGTFGVPNDINDRGQVVGVSNLSGDTASHAFLWGSGKLTDIGSLGGSYGAAWALNESGDVVGQASTAGDVALHAFLWHRGVMTDLGPLPGFGDTTCIGAFGINSHDQVVGQAMFNFCDPSQAQAAHAFLWEDGDMIDLNAFAPKGLDIRLNEVEQINDGGEMFGIGALSDGNDRAFFLIPCDENHPASKAAITAWWKAAPRPLSVQRHPYQRRRVQIRFPGFRGAPNPMLRRYGRPVSPAYRAALGLQPSPLGSLAPAVSESDTPGNWLTDNPSIAPWSWGHAGHCEVGWINGQWELNGECFAQVYPLCKVAASNLCPKGQRAKSISSGFCGGLSSTPIDPTVSCTVR